MSVWQKNSLISVEYERPLKSFMKDSGMKQASRMVILDFCKVCQPEGWRDCLWKKNAPLLAGGCCRQKGQVRTALLQPRFKAGMAPRNERSLSDPRDGAVDEEQFGFRLKVDLESE